MKILILHGWQHDKSYWEESAKALSSIAPTTAINLPGFGDQKLVSDDWGIPQYAEWVESYVKKNKIRDLVLVGHSFGGRISSYIATKNPSWLKALILVASPSIYRPSNGVRLKIMLYKLAKKILPQRLRLYFYSNDAKKANKSGLSKVFRNVVNFDQTHLLPKIEVPVLLLWGEQDTEVPLSIAQEIKMLIKNSKLEIIKSAGHMPSHNNPNLFYGKIKQFIESI